VGNEKIEVLIIDANVLIDFCKTDESVLALVVKHVATVNVAEPVLEEVSQLDRLRAEALGIRVLCPDYSCLTRAAVASQRSPLRFQDWVCLLLAEDNGFGRHELFAHGVFRRNTRRRARSVTNARRIR
jgi:hypothetical protein